MSDPTFIWFADRIGGANYGKGSDIYKFEKISARRGSALADNPDRSLIDFGIGENDSMARQFRTRANGSGNQSTREPRLC